MLDIPSPGKMRDTTHIFAKFGGSRPAMTTSFLAKRPQKGRKKCLRRRRAYMARTLGGFGGWRCWGMRQVLFCTADGPVPLRPVLKGAGGLGAKKLQRF
ncbi:MAG TPA: hypothetical protein VJ882_05430 [Desulfuromonadales bacterium]|nr:hypothetical protein [Desulfuromonadales bacterium]